MSSVLFDCVGCGSKTSEEEIVDSTQKVLNICNQCTTRPFTEFKYREERSDIND
jgi:transcription elongation factor Elf1